MHCDKDDVAEWRMIIYRLLDVCAFSAGIWWWSWWMQTCVRWFRWSWTTRGFLTCSTRCCVGSNTCMLLASFTGWDTHAHNRPASEHCHAAGDLMKQQCQVHSTVAKRAAMNFSSISHLGQRLMSVFFGHHWNCNTAVSCEFKIVILTDSTLALLVF